MLANLLAVSVRSGFVCTFQYIRRVYSLVSGFSVYLTAHLEVLFWGDLACPSVPRDDRGSKISGGTASLHPGGSAPCLLCFIMDKVSTGCLIVSKFSNFLGVSLKFSEGMLRNCELCPKKYALLPLFHLSCDGEGVNGLLHFSLTRFFVWPYFLMFCE